MKILSKLWKKQKNLSAKSDPQPEIYVLDVDIRMNHIRDVYYEKAYAEYCAGTLTFRVSRIYKELESGYKDETIFCNFYDKDATPEYLFWLAMCYLKYKSSTGTKYETARTIVTNYKDQNLAAKLLLELGCANV